MSRAVRPLVLRHRMRSLTPAGWLVAVACLVVLAHVLHACGMW